MNPRALSERELFGVSNALHTNLVVLTCVICNGSIKNRGCVCVFELIAMTEEIPERCATHQGRQIKVVCSAL